MHSAEVQTLRCPLPCGTDLEMGRSTGVDIEAGGVCAGEYCLEGQSRGQKKSAIKMNIPWHLDGPVGGMSDFGLSHDLSVCLL